MVIGISGIDLSLSRIRGMKFNFLAQQETMADTVDWPHKSSSQLLVVFCLFVYFFFLHSSSLEPGKLKTIFLVTFPSEVAI